MGHLEFYRPEYLPPMIGGIDKRDVFIDSGAYWGQTLENALKQEFGVVYGIEISEKNLDKLRVRFSDSPDRKSGRLKIIPGSSPVVLPQILDPNLSTTIWLDSHYQGVSEDEMDPAYGECPLLAELNIIYSVPWTVKPLLIIDDALYFFHNKWRESVSDKIDFNQWPTFSQIFDIVGPDHCYIFAEEKIYIW